MSRSHDDLQAAPPQPRRRAAHAAVLAAVALVAVGLVGCTKRKAEPAPLDPATYDRVVGLFYSGLGALDSGVQNDLAAAMFTTMTQLAPAEPAGWANLAVARLRMGDSDAAATALAEADKDVDDSRITFLGGLIASRTGNAEEALTLWRAAIEKDPGNLRAQYALIQELARQASPEAEAEIRTHLAAILAADPANLKALLDTARAAARSGDAPALASAVDAIAARTDELVASVSADQRQVAADLPALIAELQAAAKGDPKALASQLAMLDNLSRATEVFRVDLAKLTSSDQVIGEPLTAFLVLPVPSATPAEADGTVTFEERVLADVGPVGATTSTAVEAASAVSRTTYTLSLRSFALDPDSPPVVMRVPRYGPIVLLAEPPIVLPTVNPNAANIDAEAFDADNDRRMDLAVAGVSGLQLWRQVDRGRFEDVTASMGVSDSIISMNYSSVLPFDLELDGDMDLVLHVLVSGPFSSVVLRNNGDGTWAAANESRLDGLLPEAWFDIDRDGVNDIVGTDERGNVAAYRNLRGGRYALFDQRATMDHANGDLTVVDMDHDGQFEVVTAGSSGISVVKASGEDAPWSVTAITATGYVSVPDSDGLPPRVFSTDLDNNGAVDLVVFDGVTSHAWLAGPGDAAWTVLALPDGFRVTDVADLDADQRIDLLGLINAGRPVALMNQGGKKAYHAVTLQARAAEAADQRINSFAIGGAVEARSGRLTQKVPIDGPYIHIGLGDRTTAELVRFTWPNGTIQPEFDVAVDTPVVVEQRLKGSCPWLYAWDGTAMAFVTDVLWKSPLGLRLNAQDTAGVVTTQDWVKVRGDQLKPRVEGTSGGDAIAGGASDGAESAGGDATAGGAYFDLRVTGELWETHYWDWFGLIAVDHAPDVEVWVDERFVVPPAPLTVQPTGPVQAVAAAVDHRGRDVTDLVADRDNLYLDTFALGKYQGLAEDHWVELAIDPASVGGDLVNAVVIAQGWLYPTDSSINVALGQGTGPKPQALSLETLDGQGGWTVVEPFIGFPAGKGKTMLIDLGKLAEAPRDDAGLVRLRLRNSMEIYWDRLGVARRLPADVATVTTATLRSAVMGYHGFSMTNQYARGVQGPGAVPRSQPDTPDYNVVAATVPIWLDLAGWYTRYGPVEPLLAAVDDRYVIVTAGDEVRLAFDDVAPPADGLARDYVFQSDGWNKDGDFNTAYSATVHPLPSHDNPMYVDQQVYGATGALADDPVYRANANDWATYHTRYVSPLPVQRALWGEDR